MAGHALPFTQVLNPGIGEAPDVIVWLSLKGALRMIDSRDYRSISKEIHLDVLDGEESRFEMWVFDLGKKFLFIGELAVPFGIYKPARNQGIQGRRVTVDLSLIPQVLQNQQFALARIRLLGSQSDGAQT